MSWFRDAVLAYVAGLAIGAPAGLVAMWLTDRPEALTASITAAMAGVLLYCRSRRRRAAVAPRTA